MKRKPTGSLKEPRPLKRTKSVALAPLVSKAAFYGKPRGLDVEKKFNDISSTAYDLNTSGQFVLLHVPTRGNDAIDRVGRKTLVKNIYIRGFITSQLALTAATGTVPAQLFRMILLADMQPNGAAPQITDVLVSASSVSHINLNNRDRFRIISDEQWVADPYINVTTATQAQSSTVNQIFPIKTFRKNVNIETIYNSNSNGNIGDITSGAIYLLLVGSTAAGNNDGIAQLATRVRYTDV